MSELEKPSKTRRKKTMLELQSLGDELVALSEHQLQSMRLEPDLLEAVRAARGMTKHEARRRQMQFIGRLMREVDPAPIREQLAVWHGQSKAATQSLHDAERWRAALLEDESALTTFADRYGAAARLQPLRTCLREARREQSAAAEQDGRRPGRHFRQLFRLIREAIEAAPA
jgi:ribosome-associated protein